MEYDRIIIELLDRIKRLEERVGKLEADSQTTKTSQTGGAGTGEHKASNKYRYLTAYLRDSGLSPTRLSFGEIEKILGFTLPPSAYQYREFWANTKSHSIALSWMCEGYRTTEVSLDDQYVVFEK